jgi:hypothetical protein
VTRSQKQESALAQALGGRVTPASGAFWSHKGDIKTDALLVEAKCTVKRSITLQLSVWEKIRREAILTGRIPVLALQIQDRNLIVLDEEDFLAYHSQRGVGEGELP